jgi:apolipoprotein N-acyltransferase
MNEIKLTPLNSIQLSGLLLFSFFVVAFGQPSWSSYFGMMASTIGFACFWRVLLDVENAKERFCLGMSWYSAVQIVQLSWFLSHPYAYIYGVLLFCAWLIGLQWGFLSIWITPRIIQKTSCLLALAGSWVLLEWSRLVFF